LIVDAADYYRVVLADPKVHAGVAERGRAAGAQLTDPVGETEATAQRVLALVASTADDEVVETSVGQMMFVEYLATRASELALHTLDIQRATGQPLRRERAAGRGGFGLLAELAEPIGLLSALTGRGTLPLDYNVLAESCRRPCRPRQRPRRRVPHCTACESSTSPVSSPGPTVRATWPTSVPTSSRSSDPMAATACAGSRARSRWRGLVVEAGQQEQAHDRPRPQVAR
jgi:hypothetical protein